MSEREKIGSGWEHNIFRSSIDGWVLKKPKEATLFFLRLLTKTPGELIKEEVESNSERLTKNNIFFPETRVFTFGAGYVIAQKYVEEDNSLDNGGKRYRIEQTGDSYLINLFTREESNFRSNGGNIFCLDLTYGFNRILKGIISVEKQKRITSLLFPDRSEVCTPRRCTGAYGDSIKE